MEDIFISHLRIENKVVRNAVHALLHDVLENVGSLDFTWFQSEILASAFYNRANCAEYTNIAKKLKDFVDDHSSKIHFAMSMPLNSTRPVEPIPGFDWEGIFLTIRGLQTGTDQSHSMAKLSSTILSQDGKRDFIYSPRRDTVDSDLKHAVGAMLVLKTLKNALQTSPPGAGTSDDPIYYHHLFVDRVLRRFHEATTYGVTTTTSTFVAPAMNDVITLLTCFGSAGAADAYTPTVKLYDNPPELRPHIERIVHKILFAAAQVLLTDRRFIPDPVQFHKWTQYVVLPTYMVVQHPLAAKVVVVPTSTTTMTPALVSPTSATTSRTKPAAAAAAAVKLPSIATGASVGAGVTWNLPATSPRPATATPSPRPRSVTPSKVVINAAAATENF